jgi:uncharacterized iron-regulated protein
MHRRLALRALSLPALAMLASCAGRYSLVPGQHWQSEMLREHPLAGKIWSAAAQRFVGIDSLADSLRNAHFRLVGEVHDNPDHHAIQAKLLNALGAGGLRPSVAFEQFDREFDAALRQLQATGKISADAVADTVKFDRKGWNWNFYRPLVEIAIRYDMPLRAANLSRAAITPIAKQGMAALAPDKIAALRLETAWSADRELALREIIIEGHCHALPQTMVPNMSAAQRARDAGLAESLLDAGRDGAVLIAGNGHVRRDLGVPLYLQAAATGKGICAVGILEVDAELNEPLAYNESAVAGAPRYDFMCFTPRHERPDPCAAFTSGRRGRNAETAQ